MDQKFNGLLLVNKPAGISSVDVLRHLKRVLSKNVKMGHAGTLDPFATGLLIVCFGRGTRLVPLLTDVTKGYRVGAQFGQRTDTQDGTGRVLEQQVVPENLVDLLPQAVALLGSSYKQIPPVFSALKHEGVPLYTLVRERRLSDEELDILVAAKARWILIYKLAIESVQESLVTFSCEVSKGAYIRTLADDLAQKISLRATTLQLDRIFIGPFLVEKALSLDVLNSAQDVAMHLIDVEKARTLLA
jgi:tRNA pseudouridine55 synthase